MSGINTPELMIGGMFCRATSTFTPDGAGLISILDIDGELMIPDLSTLKGIAINFEDGTAFTTADNCAVLTSLSVDGTATVKHNDLTVDADQRIHCESGADVALDEFSKPLRYRKIGGAWAWYLSA